MNVRAYWTKAALAGEALLERLGWDRQSLRKKNIKFVQTDAHTKFMAEQLLDAHLSIDGGVIDVDGPHLHLHFDMVNDKQQKIAASFRNELTLFDGQTDKPVNIPQEMRQLALSTQIDWPEHGRPRGLGLTPLDDSLTVDQMEQLGLKPVGRVIEVLPEICDEDGLLIVRGLIDLRSAKTAEKRSELIVPEFKTPEGERVGMPTVESRQSIVRIPRAGDRISSHRAFLSGKGKVMHNVNWNFNAETGEIVAALQQVSVAMNLHTRRAINIPEELQAYVSKSLRPELAKYAGLA